MDIASETVNGVTVVRLEGNLDTASSDAAQAYLFAAIDRGAARMVVNLEKVDFVSSLGLRVLLLAAKRLGAGLRICGLNDSVAEVFEITGFNTILDVACSETDALAGF
jgi:anti-anti-sigma factor